VARTADELIVGMIGPERLVKTHVGESPS
jgi:hypothetical protein